MFKISSPFLRGTEELLGLPPGGVKPCVNHVDKLLSLSGSFLGLLCPQCPES